jgi:hypothetical protein
VDSEAYGKSANNCESDHYQRYVVQPGDALYKLGISYGDIRFWESIYIANADQIEVPDLIFVGQTLKIPQPIFSFSESDRSLQAVLKNPFCDLESLPISAVDMSWLSLYDKFYFESGGRELAESEPSPSRRDSVLLSELRDAFNSVLDEEERSDDGLGSAAVADANRERIQQQSERQIMMEIDGMVLDETRSKVGRDFYDVFYTNWQQPPDTHNFSIRISEQPSPSLGTIIYVEVNDTETFRMRLQPRYDFIQQAGRYAVRQTYSYLQNNDHQLQIY